MEFYDSLSYSCYLFVPLGINSVPNYASYVYTAIRGTLDSVQTLLKTGRISDAYTLVRKYFDDALIDIYIDVIRKDRFDWGYNRVVKDVDEWLRSKYRLPSLKKMLSTIKNSDRTKEIYPFFGWDTYFKHNRELLDDSVHGNRYKLVILNCNEIYFQDREKHLQNIYIVVKQIFTMHLAFVFHLNSHYMMSSDYSDYRDLGFTPPEDCESRIAPFAQKAFDTYIKKDEKLATFIKEHSCLNIA